MSRYSLPSIKQPKHLAVVTFREDLKGSWFFRVFPLRDPGTSWGMSSRSENWHRSENGQELDYCSDHPQPSIHFALFL